MNKDWVLFNLKETLTELKRTVKEIEKDKDYDSGELFVAMQHSYHHLNTAWNSRESTKRQTKLNSKKDFYKWRKFPKDIYMGP